MNCESILAIAGFVALLLIVAWQFYANAQEMKKSRAHVIACGGKPIDVNSPEWKIMQLEKENAKLRQEVTDLTIKNNRTEYR